ncbi:hypothetical protein J4G43_037670 [Bradyrhizobium barranii subsp. barranii]|uniref:Uncharacterized protein n=1 Tax=Bradyrhizobium barranii subsp. barranii TaxID=2823807 RepID=A0A939S253_9BRAD|nr:hypothetical protein [Bradyrhizobium barranii]UEM10347.1 hypothetical protein J4G43_037670 [Bradyrhizobium barranii subsp. barranii]
MTRPGKSTADGQHWVYRVEGQRRCWFQIAEGTERAKKLVQQRATKHRVAAAEENQTAARKRKTVVDARAELPRSAPADTSRPSPSVVDASPVLATGIATRASPAPFSKRDRLTADEITPRQVDVEALLAAAPAASDVVAASAAPLAFSAAEAGDDGRVWTWLGMLLMALGLVSVLSASLTIRWAALLPQLLFACQRRVDASRQNGPRAPWRRGSLVWVQQGLWGNAWRRSTPQLSAPIAVSIWRLLLSRASSLEKFHAFAQSRAAGRAAYSETTQFRRPSIVRNPSAA